MIERYSVRKLLHELIMCELVYQETSFNE